MAMLTGKAAEINITAMIGIARDAWPDLKVGFIIAKIDGDS
ncbi:MAG TPA: hypothetical protein VE998_11430 [Terriglobales bacterium]|nr:hypothetical protein [Terriglobales bacterium]